MGNLRIKLKYKSFEIEFEGEEKAVQTEFKDIKQKGLGNIVNGIDISEPSYIIETLPKQIQGAFEKNDEIITDVDSDDIPTLKDIVMKQLPSSETEWILIYAYYSRDSGNMTFTSKNILEYYEKTNRKTDSRNKNMSSNLKSLFKKGYFSALNDNEYIITDIGEEEVIKILTRGSSDVSQQTRKSPVLSNKKKNSGSKKRTSNKSKSTVDNNKFKVLKNLNFRPDGKTSLLDFSEYYNIKSNPDRIAVIIQYLKEILNIETISGDHIYSGFWELKCKMPEAFYQGLINAKNRSKYIEFIEITNIELSVQGSNHIRFDIKKN